MSNSEGEQGSEHGEPPAEANAQSDTTKKGRASKSAIGKTAKKPAQSPTRTRVAGKRSIVAPDICNPEELSEKRAEALQLSKKGKKVSVTVINQLLLCVLTTMFNLIFWLDETAMAIVPKILDALYVALILFGRPYRYHQVGSTTLWRRVSKS